MSRAASEAHSVAPLCSWSLRDFFGVANAVEPAHCPAVTRKVRLVWGERRRRRAFVVQGTQVVHPCNPPLYPRSSRARPATCETWPKSGSHPILTLHLTEIICQSRLLSLCHAPEFDAMHGPLAGRLDVHDGSPELKVPEQPAAHFGEFDLNR